MSSDTAKNVSKSPNKTVHNIGYLIKVIDVYLKSSLKCKKCLIKQLWEMNNIEHETCLDIQCNQSNAINIVIENVLFSFNLNELSKLNSVYAVFFNSLMTHSIPLRMTVFISLPFRFNRFALHCIAFLQRTHMNVRELISFCGIRLIYRQFCVLLRVSFSKGVAEIWTNSYSSWKETQSFAFHCVLFLVLNMPTVVLMSRLHIFISFHLDKFLDLPSAPTFYCQLIELN